MVSTQTTCGSSVAAGSNCSIGVFFDPTAMGTRTGTLSVTDNAAGSPQTVTLTGMGQDFAVAPSGSATATVAPGQTANYTIAVTPYGGFDQTVTLSCSGAPAQSACSLSSSSVALNGSTPASVTVTVTTAGSTASLAHPAGFPPANGTLAVWLAFCGLSGLALLGSDGRSRKRHGRLLYGLAFLCLISLGIALSSCGGGSTSTGAARGNSRQRDPARLLRSHRDRHFHVWLDYADPRYEAYFGRAITARPTPLLFCNDPEKRLLAAGAGAELSLVGLF